MAYPCCWYCQNKYNELYKVYKYQGSELINFEIKLVVISVLSAWMCVCVCVYLCAYTYGNLLHENSVGGLSFVQQAVHVLHTAGGCAQLLTQLFFGWLHSPHKWFYRPNQSRMQVKWSCCVKIRGEDVEGIMSWSQ